jgi:hypothetical protein
LVATALGIFSVAVVHGSTYHARAAEWASQVLTGSEPFGTLINDAE